MRKRSELSQVNRVIAGRVGIEHECSAPDVRYHLLQQLQPLAQHGKINEVKPVILPPGRPKLAMKPWATGSLTAAKTSEWNSWHASAPQQLASYWLRSHPGRMVGRRAFDARSSNTARLLGLGQCLHAGLS